MKKRGILIVDDDEVVLTMMSEWLVQSGYTVFTAENVAGAMDTFKEHEDEIDLLLSDVKLLNETGFDLADALEREYGFQDHVFFTSFFYDEDIVEELLRRGKPYFEKPLKFKQVILPFLERHFREKQDDA
jgi:DNA-binding NtrC family response regulator